MKKVLSGFGGQLILMMIMSLFLIALMPQRSEAAVVKRKNCTLVSGQAKQLKNRINAVWKVKNAAVVDVNETGLITALKKGKTTVTCKVGKKKYIYKIKVEDPYFKATTLNLDLKKSKTLKLKGTTKKFKITSSDPEVMSVVKKAANKVRITALKDGVATLTATFKNVTRTCIVTCGKGEEKKTQFSLYYNGIAVQTLTYTKSDVARYVGSISGYGQSAPLYTSVNGGDGLESIFAETNNGNVSVEGVQLAEDARQGTIAKACLWARAVCDSQYHGYDDGQTHAIDTWGIAKSGSPGTGDYCCYSLAECAYYFAGVNVLGECLGNTAAAIYPPYSSQLFEHRGVSFWGDTEPRPCSPRGSIHIFPRCGFDSIGRQDMYQPGDIVVSFFKGQQHEELVIQAGSAKTCQVAEAYGPGGGGRKGGDQSGVELTVKTGIYKPGSISYVFRFTGKGVVLNTVGLAG